ncbi:MAG: TonB-dependent receptor plug domain-containing protein, partial [Tahibacter sp.]
MPKNGTWVRIYSLWEGVVPMLKLKRNVLSVALATAMLSFAAGVHAESAEPESTPAEPAEQPSADATTAADKDRDAKKRAETTLEEVSVVGIRRGIETAIEVKQDATSIVEVVSAEDLGKLPDISIADSIARLPGLAAQRVAGRASTISIRGLSGDYGTTLLNGREQVSVGDNRTVEFDQFPSELINQVVVYKTPDAALIGQGLSGTVDLRTVRPLSFPKQMVSLNVRGEKNSLGALNSDSDDTGSRVSAFYLDQFLDNRVGIALGYARLDSPGQAERWESYGYPNDISPAAGSFTIGGSKSQASSTSNVRQGLMGVLEYRPNDVYSGTVDMYYSKFDKAETTRFLEAGLGWSGAHLVDPVIENGVVTSGRFTNVRPVIRNDLNEGNDKLFAIGWNNEFHISEDWSAKLDLSHSKADRHESILETYAGSRAGVFDTVDFTLHPNGPPDLHFGADYTDPSSIVLTDPGGWGQDGYIKTPQVRDTLDSFRVDFERSFGGGLFSSVQFGANYADREKKRSVP